MFAWLWHDITGNERLILNLSNVAYITGKPVNYEAEIKLEQELYHTPIAPVTLELVRSYLTPNINQDVIKLYDMLIAEYNQQNPDSQLATRKPKA